MLSGIIRNEFTLMGEEATNRMFTAKIRTILNTIYYHLGSFSYSSSSNRLIINSDLERHLVSINMKTFLSY